MADTGAADTGAKSSGDPDGSSIQNNQASDDIIMSNVIYSIAADEKLKEKFEIWDNKYEMKMRKGIDDDVEKMSKSISQGGVRTQYN